MHTHWRATHAKYQLQWCVDGAFAFPIHYELALFTQCLPLTYLPHKRNKRWSSVGGSAAENYSKTFLRTFSHTHAFIHSRAHHYLKARRWRMLLISEGIEICQTHKNLLIAVPNMFLRSRQHNYVDNEDTFNRLMENIINLCSHWRHIIKYTRDTMKAWDDIVVSFHYSLIKTRSQSQEICKRVWFQVGWTIPN